jgi:hypothetical protein
LVKETCITFFGDVSSRHVALVKFL